MDFYHHLLSCSSRNLISCLTCLIFLKSSWWLVWTFSAQTHLKFQMNLLKAKIRKEHKKIFCGPSKNFTNISWTINIWLKYFITPAKTLQPAPTYLMYSPSSTEKLTTPITTDDSLSSSIKWYKDTNFCLIFKGSCLRQKNATFTPLNRIHFFYCL